MLRLTKFEIVRIIGERAQQIANGAPSVLDISSFTNAIEIAKEELRQGVVPITIIRTLPSGKTIEVVPRLEPSQTI